MIKNIQWNVQEIIPYTNPRCVDWNTNNNEGFISLKFIYLLITIVIIIIFFLKKSFIL